MGAPPMTNPVLWFKPTSFEEQKWV